MKNILGAILFAVLLFGATSAGAHGRYDDYRRPRGYYYYAPQRHRCPPPRYYYRPRPPRQHGYEFRYYYQF